MSTSIDGHRVALDATFVTRLAVALELVDARTGAPASGVLMVRMIDPPRPATRSLSGLFAFCDVPDGPRRIRIDAEHYHAQEVPVELPPLVSPPGWPLLTVGLVPNTAFPFAAGTTLVRGTVRDAVGRPIEGAVLSVRDTSMTARSDARGDYVLAFAPLKDKDIIRKDKRRFVKIGSGTAATIRAEHAAHGVREVGLADGIEEGRTTVVTLRL